ncbi:PilZ domain-containing protein [Simiduia curdlanivorans]|uniref:Cyclic diguanosine monophosphate-binding protein n=1 Tax=Simiduia curdlanivorans TaxID=1492769 RepID=A0ABV8V431_9GAMM|nr:PilZ domain-containing protein [Simiduia curdlanivorans]MDN3637392.1 PilZ domain-containing protein [Simiduia curdlanivorans]
MDKQQERRRFVRVSFQEPVLLSQNGNTWSCELIDISLKGALLQPPVDCTPIADDALTLTLALDDNNAIQMIGSLVHQQDEQLGLYCERIDIDSMAHLRKLIELNTGDPSAAEREFKRLGQAD